MSNKLSLMPNISIPRSRFKQSFNHSLDMFHGDIVPVDCFEVLPGDEFSYQLSSLIRMSTPILPVMGNIKAHVHAFFVPLRLIWDDAEKFYGDPSNHDKVSTITPIYPGTFNIPNVTSGYVSSGVPFLYSVQDYLGKNDLEPIKTLLGSSPFTNWLAGLKLSVLKERAYLTIWNDHFRPSLMVNPVVVAKGSSATNYGTHVGSGMPTQFNYPFKPLKGFKGYDYFTANTLSPQYASAAVELPLAGLAPVGVYTTGSGSIRTNYNLFAGLPDDVPVYANTFKRLRMLKDGGGEDTLNGEIVYANLQNVAAATINDIRYAFQLQKYFERSNYGNRYFEILNAHYGITNPDSRLQRAERLGSHEFYINISQVVSTADTESGSSGKSLGNTGAVSVTGDNCHLFTKSFSEPGYIMVVITTKFDRSYSAGWLREDMKSNKFEFYSPEFANLGDQATKMLEVQTLYYDSGSGTYKANDSTEVFGYQEHWAEYRYRKDLISGSLRVGQNFDVWTLGDSFEGVPTAAATDFGYHAPKVVLGYDFLVEDRNSLARVLATGTNGPDYICDFHANIIATREMPLYSIPGLIDHFGAL